ncbi:hypothetical protein IWX90DRAFT_489644 [Phyllosticta citrichinensis]|uniref:Homeobox domain-containing protein n=1 Tax=Phyllosticta citrichinensis TaxID=1130410 RepID=A0ABR1XHU4_9PEZI
MSIRDITTPSQNSEPRHELPPISELFQTVDSSDARRQDHDNYLLERRAPRHEHGTYTTQPGPYHTSAYQPRFDRRTALRAEYEPRLPRADYEPRIPAEPYSVRPVATPSNPDGPPPPPPFVRESHVHPHASQVPHVPHVIGSYPNHPYQPHYLEAQYAHHPNVFYHAETGQYIHAWNGEVGPNDPNFGRKRRGNLPKEATNRLKRWFADHGDSPYPSEEEKVQLSRETGLGLNQISNWFINARRRQPGRDAREALQREQELRQEQHQMQQQQQSASSSSQPSSTPSPTDESSSSVASIELDRGHSRYEVLARSSPPRTRSSGVVTSPYSHGATRYSERHSLHRSSRRSSTPETRRERRHR